MIKILMIGMTDNRGGIESFVMNYYRKFDRAIFKIDFVNIYEKGLYFEREIQNNNDIIYNLSNYYKFPIKYMKELNNIILNNCYDVVYCNMNSAVMLFPLIVAKKCNVKVRVCHAHNASSDKGWLKKLFHAVNKSFIPILANKYVACSNKAGEWFFSKKILSSNNYEIINNSIDSNEFKFNHEIREKYRKILNIPSDSVVVGHVGRFDKQKNHDFLLDIFYKIMKMNNNFYLVLIGDGELKESIKQKAINLGIEKNMIFLGIREDISCLYNAMDIFVLPSLYEGLPLVSVEAQCSGLKCFFSSVITTQTKLLDSTEYIDLSSGAEFWAKRIINSKNYQNRDEAYLKIVDQGFDLNSEVKKMEEKILDWISQNNNL